MQNAGIQILTSTKFKFDGVIYENKYLEQKLGKIRNLLSTSRVIEGKPRKNELYWVFVCLKDGEFDYRLTKKKISPPGTIFAKRGMLFDLIHQIESGELTWEVANDSTVKRPTRLW